MIQVFNCLLNNEALTGASSSDRRKSFTVDKDLLTSLWAMGGDVEKTIAQ